LSNTSRKKQLKDMKSKFKVGDRVRMKRTVCFDYITFEKGCVGEVLSDEDNKGFCSIRMKNAESGEITGHSICACNLEPIDSKTAFISELKGLLEKYDAQIGCNPVHDDEFEICIDFKDSMVSYPSYIQWLNAGYVSHFKKE
jgi:hypothetical protein